MKNLKKFPHCLVSSITPGNSVKNPTFADLDQYLQGLEETFSHVYCWLLKSSIIARRNNFREFFHWSFSWFFAYSEEVVFADQDFAKLFEMLGALFEDIYTILKIGWDANFFVVFFLQKFHSHGFFDFLLDFFWKFQISRPFSLSSGPPPEKF